MTRKTTDEIAEVEHQIAKAHESRESAHAEYRSYLQAEDMAAAKHARDSMRRADGEIEVLGDRLAILRKREAEEAQRIADQRLKQAIKRAEEAAEKERMAAAEVDAVREQMAVLLDRLKATSDESFRASAAMIQAADAAERDAPRVRTVMTSEADPNTLATLAKHIGGLFNQQSRGAVEQTRRRRRAG